MRFTCGLRSEAALCDGLLRVGEARPLAAEPFGMLGVK
jgi:hypothetical protein